VTMLRVVRCARRSRAVKTNALRHYSRANSAGINLSEGFGLDAEGVPETLIIPGVAGEYAMNFFRESYKRGGSRVAQAFELELNILTWSVREDSDWDIVTTSPFFDAAVREKHIREKCKALKLSSFFTNRLLTLLKNDVDITRLEQIRADYEELMRTFRRERPVVLVTGRELSPAEVDFFKHSLEVTYMTAGDHMVFSHQVDRSILGGIRVVVDGFTYDHAWTETTISDSRKEFENEGLNKLRPPPPAPGYGLDADLFEKIAKLLPHAGYSKDAIQDMRTFMVKKS